MHLNDFREKNWDSHISQRQGQLIVTFNVSQASAKRNNLAQNVGDLQIKKVILS